MLKFSTIIYLCLLSNNKLYTAKFINIRFFKAKNYGFRKIRQESPNGGKIKKGTIKAP